jgi:hypothetical protein
MWCPGHPHPQQGLPSRPFLMFTENFHKIAHLVDTPSFFGEYAVLVTHRPGGPKCCPSLLPGKGCVRDEKASNLADGDDAVYGGAGNDDNLNGEGSSDTVYGGRGNDSIGATGSGLYGTRLSYKNTPSPARPGLVRKRNPGPDLGREEQMMTQTT